MPIIKHIPIYYVPKKFLSYVTNEKKTEGTLVTGLNCSTNAAEAYEEMKLNFEMYAHERFFKKLLKSETAKQKIRLHHYIQSFKPGEVTPEQAHRIGVEWAEKVFGKNHMVLCATHCDRSHVHNHFAVLPYDLDGKHWYANRTTMKMCRKISDEIALAHGLEVIEYPKYKAAHKYGEYQARKDERSWKQKLCDEIDSLILNENVRNVDDLAKELEAKGYGIRRGKYFFIKVRPDRKAIRSYRLGDGYSLEHLAYRIANKNREMPLALVVRYTGIQRLYALCIRQLQMELYRKPEKDRLHFATYNEVEKSSWMMYFLKENNIHSMEDFKNVVNDADRKVDELKEKRSELLEKIAMEEKLISEIPKYLEVLNRRPLLAKDVRELAKYNYIKDAGVKSEEDRRSHKDILAGLRKELADTEEKIPEALAIRKSVYDYYNFYESRMKSDYEILLEKAKAELEELRRAEEMKMERQQQELSERSRESRTNSRTVR